MLPPQTLQVMLPRKEQAAGYFLLSWKAIVDQQKLSLASRSHAPLAGRANLGIGVTHNGLHDSQRRFFNLCSAGANIQHDNILLLRPRLL